MGDMALALCEVLLVDRELRAGTQKLIKIMEKHKEFGGWVGGTKTFLCNLFMICVGKNISFGVTFSSSKQR